MKNIYYAGGLSCAGILPVLMVTGATEALVGFVALLGAALMTGSIEK